MKHAVVCFALTLLLSMIPENDGQRQPCTESGCVVAAANLIGNIDFSVDPCQDFSKFACGKWIKNHQIPDDQSKIDPLIEISGRVNKLLRTLFEDYSDWNSTTKSIQFAKLLYRKCMDISVINTLRSQPIHKFLNDIGGWPVLNRTWDENFLDLTTLTGLIMQSYYVNTLIQLRVDIDMQDKTKHILQVDMIRNFGLRQYYINDSIYNEQIEVLRKLFLGTVGYLASDLNITASMDVALHDWSQILDFEKKLAQITLPAEDQRTSILNYNHSTLADFSSIYNIINWEKYLEFSMPRCIFNKVVKNQSDVFQIVVIQPENFKKLNALLLSIDKRTLFNVIIWRWIAEVAMLLDYRFSPVGKTGYMARSNFCLEGVKTVAMASSALYVRNHFSAADKREARRMVLNLKKSFRYIVQHSNWMDNATKKRAVEKVNHMFYLIGYPDLLLNDTMLDKYYRNLKYEPNLSFFDLFVTHARWRLGRDFSLLLKKTNKYRFLSSPLDVNAYAFHMRNIMIFPAAILQPPLFHYDYPKFLNYASMGAIISHELTHGFDDLGHHYDKNGAVKDWWSKRAARIFHLNAKCIQRQYDAFVEPLTSRHVNGKLTLGENIADNGGLKCALEGYYMYLKRAGIEKPLPGLNFTIMQTFFVNYAATFCANVKFGEQVRLLVSDAHSPGIFRINGPLRNNPLFAKTFKCPKGSPMNPVKKCAVW